MIGWQVFWLVIAIELAACAIVTWRRAGLPFMTAGMGLGAIQSLILAVLYGLGYTIASPPSSGESFCGAR